MKIFLSSEIIWYNLVVRKFSIQMIVIAVIILLGVFALTRGSDTTQEPAQESVNKTSQLENSPKDCSGKALTPLTEGPYYKADSPQRQNITEEGTSGTHLILKGYVFNTDCKPVANAWLDFWQADGEGNYDNTGYNLRGHQYTDEDGFFRLETVVPGQYPGRTAHIHFKLRASETSPAITAQLFFPDSSGNSTDSIFDESLVVEFGTDPDGSKFAAYNIIVPKSE